MSLTIKDVQAWVLNDAKLDDLDQIQTLIQTRRQMQFKVGDKVWFDAKTRGIIHGTITKMNSKSAKVTSNTGATWTVGPNLLNKDDLVGKVNP